MQCPEGHLAMRLEVRNGNYDNKYYNYFFSIKKCKKCVRYGTCCKKDAKQKSHCVTVKGQTREKQEDFQNTDYFKTRAKERYMIEAKNAELKQSHGLRRCNYVGLFGMKIQIFFSAFVANIKRIIKLSEPKTV